MGKPVGSLPYMAQLDGLRTLAVIAVAVKHWYTPSLFGMDLELGKVGVQMFFVLSGFLITRILMDTADAIADRPSERRQAVRSFFIRRALRLLPAYYLYLAVIMYVLPLNGDPNGVGYYLLHLSNFRIQAVGAWPPGVAHLWTLAAEEQFYLFVPFVVFGLSRRYLPHFFAAGWAIAFTVGVTTNLTLVPPVAFAGMFIGCLLAMLSTMSEERKAIVDRVSILGIPVAIVGVVVLGGVGDLPTAVGINIYGVGAAGIVWRAASDNLSRVLSMRPMLFCGRISYGIYLWHMAAWWIVQRVFGTELVWWLDFSLSFGLTIGIAVLSFRLVEAPVTRLKSKYPYVREAARPTVVTR